MPPVSSFAVLIASFAITIILLIGFPLWVRLLARRSRRLAHQRQLFAEAMTATNPWDRTHITVINGRMMTVGEISSELQRIRRDLEAQRPTRNTLSRSKVESFETCKASDTLTDTCVICLSEFTADDKLRKLSCEHVFHPKCIDEWLLERSSCCPICKRDYSDNQATSGPTGPTIPPLAHM